MEGKFFFIRSALSNLVLEIADGIDAPGQKVTTGRSAGLDHQLWYEDATNQSIRSKLNDDLVFEMKDDELMVNLFEPEEFNQRWRVAGNKICHCEDDEKVLDIADHCEDEGAKLCCWEYNGGDNQHWNIENLPPKYCFIVSKMNGKVIDVKDGGHDPGTKIVMWNKKDTDNENQLFWEDKYGFIRWKMNDFVFDSADGTLRLQPYDPTLDSRKWVKDGQKIVNKADPGTCVDIKKANSSKGAKLVGYEYTASDNQHWSFEYV